MSGSPFVRKATISKHSGPVYINSYALKGIGVRYRNPFSNIDPVSLPTGWVPPQLTDSYRVDLSLEYSVLEQAKARKRAIIGEVPDPNSSLRANTLNPVPLIPYQSSTILTPIPVNSESTAMGTGGLSMPPGDVDPLTKPLGEMSLRDFEGDSNDPFEAISLQAIDDFSELQSVLQPELTSTVQPPSQAPPPINNAVPVTTSSNESTPPYSFHPSSTTTTTNPQPPAYSPPSGPGNIPPQQTQSVRPPPTGGVGVLVNFGNPVQPVIQPTPPPVSSSSMGTSISPAQPRRVSPVPPPTSPSFRPRPSPPMLPKPTRVQFSADPASIISTSPHMGPGIPVIPVNREPLPPPYTEGHTPPYQEQDLYITTPSSAYCNPSPSPSPSPPPIQFQLPDIQSSLTVAEREAVSGLSGMGFPPTRVARAYKRLNGDNQAVLDFLFQVGELEEKGFNGDSAEAALLTHDKDVTKSIEYLNQVAQYKEMWAEESIHNAYQSSGKDWEKTIDILTQ